MPCAGEEGVSKDHSRLVPAGFDAAPGQSVSQSVIQSESLSIYLCVLFHDVSILSHAGQYTIVIIIIIRYEREDEEEREK